jgi:hypothetical protein
MDTILNLVAVAGFVGSLALVAWGMVLCLTHGLDVTESASEGRWHHTNLPAGTSH